MTCKCGCEMIEMAEGNANDFNKTIYECPNPKCDIICIDEWKVTPDGISSETVWYKPTEEVV